MARLAKLPEGLALADIERVEFYKRDQITTDLICCEIQAAEKTFYFDEEQEGWDDLLLALQQLDGFHKDWFAHVSQPPFQSSEFVAFKRSPE